jgi:hypothetical protein
MKEAGIQLRPVNSLLTGAAGQPARYWIPGYQRGYRWTELQVTQLLDDIWEFIQTSEGGSRQAFYCLQPLVIKARPEGDYEVVDGQQRLTTLYILLTYLSEMVAMLGKTRFQLRFETRGAANEPFLAHIDQTRAEENVDFFHISAAYRAIEKWFEGRDGMHKLKLLQHLLNDDEAGRNVKVIWFELAIQDDPVAAFTRLNVGKIPLSNDELIRALFLRKAAAEDSGQGLALRIAHEWDQMEKALQRDAFWFFLSNAPAPASNRIGMLFDLVAAKDMDDLLRQDAYGVFQVFSRRLKVASAESEWLTVKQTFMALEEWYEDRELFHVVGFLIQQGDTINALLEAAATRRKGEFADELRRRAFARAIGGDLTELDDTDLTARIREHCEGISYARSPHAIRTLLLLFNLATLLENPRSNLRFQFDSFKRENWDIEHVRAVAARRPERHNERVNWFRHCQGYLQTREDGQALAQAIGAFIALPQREAEDARFDSLYDQVLDYFRETGEAAEHGLSNLTLLDSGTNRSYKNAVFAVKRQRLLELDQSGIFVPLCTRNVFLKCYSPQVDNAMFWSAQDATAYSEVIIGTLSSFFRADEEMRA